MMDANTAKLVEIGLIFLMVACFFVGFAVYVLWDRVRGLERDLDDIKDDGVRTISMWKIRGFGGNNFYDVFKGLLNYLGVEVIAKPSNLQIIKKGDQ